MGSSIHIKTIIAEGSTLTENDVTPFEQKVDMALQRAVSNRPGDVYCNIGVDGTIPEATKNQMSKIADNVYAGFIDEMLPPLVRHKIIFGLLAIKEKGLKAATNVVVLISCNPMNPPEKDTKYNSAASKKKSAQDDDDKLPSYQAVSPKFDLDSVILDETTHNQILRSISLIKNQRLIFETWGFNEVDPNTKTILCFYGAPGTGKTMCAHALARKLGKNILIASYASIESKWVGEGPKNMRKIFEDAAAQDAILFFDEADSFLSKRVNNAETGSDKHYNRMSNEMFQLLEDFDGVVIFATNLVTDFDKAFKSRILSFVEFTLPDDKTRQRLIKSMMPSKLPLTTPLAEQDFEILASLAQGFSGREIRKALLTSLSEAALNSKSQLSVEDLKVGFMAVQAERTAIEQSASRERNIISAYIEATQQNAAIIDICHWAFDHQEKASDASKECFYKICKSLDADLPDLTISYRSKDLSDTAKVIREAERKDEALCDIALILGYANVSSSEAAQIIDTAAEALESPKAELLTKYYTLIKQIMS